MRAVICEVRVKTASLQIIVYNYPFTCNLMAAPKCLAKDVEDWDMSDGGTVCFVVIDDIFNPDPGRNPLRNMFLVDL